jgi:8-oxo-dGTP diphosphatase
VPLYLVRHAKAGSRGDWPGPDRERPLTRKGHEQAAGIARLLANEPITDVLSSPYVRCLQSVEPLADKLGLKVRLEPALAEAASTEAALKLLRALVDGGETAVLCSHGDVIPALIDTLVEVDGLAIPPGAQCAKGSTWVLEPDNRGRFVSSRYLPPPN